MSILRLSMPLVLVAGPALPASPIAEVVYAPAEEMTDRLTQRFGVSRSGLGLRDPESRMELWSSPETGAWTLVVAYASGRSCIVAMGEHWETIALDPA